MSKESEYNINKDLVFSECHMKRKDRHTNCHHVVFRNDLEKHKVPPNFPINSRHNLIPLPVETHEKLHQIVDSFPQYKDIQLRVYMANMAFNGELDCIPDRMYRSDPVEKMREWWHGDKQS